MFPTVKPFTAFFLALLTIIFPPDLQAQSENDNGSTAEESAQAGEDSSGDSSRTFGGLNWGVGVSLTWDLGDNRRVESASVVNGIVRIDDQQNARARILLETHFFLTPQTTFVGLTNDNDSDVLEWGVGPFVALQPGGDEIIDAIAAGVMFGFKRGPDPKETSSWNFGVGAIIDPNVRILGDGLEPNEALPNGETEIRYKEKEQVGALFLFSASF